MVSSVYASRTPVNSLTCVSSVLRRLDQIREIWLRAAPPPTHHTARSRPYPVHQRVQGTCLVLVRCAAAKKRPRGSTERSWRGEVGRFSHPGGEFRRRALGVQPNGHHPSLSLLGEFRWSHGVRRQRLRRADCCEKHRNGGVAATHQNASQLVTSTEGLQLRRASHLRCPAASKR